MDQRSAPGAAERVAGASDLNFLAAILAIGALLRIWIPFAHVFLPSFVNFQTHDSWYHVRLIEGACGRSLGHVKGNVVAFADRLVRGIDDQPFGAANSEARPQERNP